MSDTKLSHDDWIAAAADRRRCKIRTKAGRLYTVTLVGINERTCVIMFDGGTMARLPLSALVGLTS